VHPSHIPLLIGTKGAVINAVRDALNVQVSAYAETADWRGIGCRTASRRRAALQDDSAARKNATRPCDTLVRRTPMHPCGVTSHLTCSRTAVTAHVLSLTALAVRAAWMWVVGVQMTMPENSKQAQANAKKVKVPVTHTPWGTQCDFTYRLLRLSVPFVR
jgi:hypothetical protein